MGVDLLFDTFPVRCYYPQVILVPACSLNVGEFFTEKTTLFMLSLCTTNSQFTALILQNGEFTSASFPNGKQTYEFHKVQSTEVSGGEEQSQWTGKAHVCEKDFVTAHTPLYVT